MNKVGLLALIIFASVGPIAQGADLRLASPAIAVELLDRQIEETKEYIRVHENSAPELANARELLKLAKIEFRRTHGVEPDFAPSDLLEADEKLLGANARLRKIQNISQMDKEYLKESLAELLDQRESLRRSLAESNRNQPDGNSAIYQSKSFMPKRSPAVLGGREHKAELVAPGE